MGCLDGLKDKRFLVVGDMIVDHYRFLRPTRLSPEAPVVIFQPESEEFRPGGAGNVANNLLALGAGEVHLCAVVGQDWVDGYHSFYGNPIGAEVMLARASGKLYKNVVVSKSKRTTIKERLTTRRQQVARVDIQDAGPIRPEDETALLDKALMLRDEIDAVVFSDYEHGVLTARVVDQILQHSVGKVVVVNTKAKDSIQKYRAGPLRAAADLVIVSHNEARDVLGMHEFEDEYVSECMAKAMRAKAAMVTLGPRGALLAVGLLSARHYPALDEAGEVVDVTGAGDTVTAAMAASLSLGRGYDASMAIAQSAAAVVVRKQGVATASPAEIDAALSRYASGSGG